jgi:5-methyltetrahydrofolate--homocysteine methyltransferase
LITPSLDEMVHVAKEMQRRNFTMPLLIGGATTSKTHTAVKIEEHYKGPVIHVLDASRSVAVATTLMSSDSEATSKFISQTREDYEKIRVQRAGKRTEKRMLTYEAARQNKLKIDWATYTPPTPAYPGVTVLEDFPFGGNKEIHRLDAILPGMGIGREISGHPY